jgi:16S rRNA (guanine966-N2)-methyltransferase
MRVIAGEHKGRRLSSPRAGPLRPTSGRVKEALFSILGERTVGARFLDLFAGTGAIGIEALSRGAARATFVEPHPSSLKLLRANLVRCTMQPLATIEPCSVEAFLGRRRGPEETFEVIFADPPYGADLASTLLPALDEAGIMAGDSIVILEHATKVAVPPTAGRLSRRRQYRYGDTTLSVYTVPADQPEHSR